MPLLVLQVRAFFCGLYINIYSFFYLIKLDMYA